MADVLTCLSGLTFALVYIGTGCAHGRIFADIVLGFAWLVAIVAAGSPVYFKDKIVVFDKEKERYVREMLW